MMKNQYSKKLICEAVRYWKNILKTINETEHHIRNVLVQKFGKQIFNTQIRLTLTPESVKQIYGVLNHELFNDELSMPNIQLINYSGTNHLASYNYRYYRKNLSDDYFTLVTEPLRISEEKILLPPVILIGSQMSNKVTIMYFINVLCHEMIHLYNIENDTALNEIFKCKIQGKDWDSHSQIFLKYMNIVNDKGLNVKINSSDDLDFEFDDAIKNLNENDNFRFPENTTISNDGLRITTRLSSDVFYEVYDEILF